MAIDNVKFAYGGIIVYVAVISVKENYLNAITPLTIPTTETTPNTTSLINLNKIEDRFTVTGHLTNGKLNATEDYTSAEDKKNGLKTMFGKGNVVVMTWEGTDYNVAVDKYEIGYEARDDDNFTQEGEIAYDVTISCIVGVDLV